MPVQKKMGSVSLSKISCFTIFGLYVCFPHSSYQHQTVKQAHRLSQITSHLKELIDMNNKYATGIGWEKK
jgi:hypothetical protein